MKDNYRDTLDRLAFSEEQKRAMKAGLLAAAQAGRSRTPRRKWGRVIAAAAVAAALCAVVVRQRAGELGAALALAAAALLLGAALGAVEDVAALMDELAELAGLSPAVLAPVVKTVGIAVLTRISAEVCRDAGESGVAASVETAGAVLALWVALPLLRAVLDTVTGLL